MSTETLTEPAATGTNEGNGQKPRRGILHRVLYLTLDPVHIGAGGTQLGRVDLSIIREPGTRLPKIPGTTLNGVARAYAAYQNGDLRCAGQGGEAREDATEDAELPPGEQDGSAKSAKKDRVKGHCADPSCPVCYAFGSLRVKITADGEKETVQARAGTVNLFDAHVLFWPVPSSRGPIWVTTVDRLLDAGIEFTGKNGEAEIPQMTDGEARVTTGKNDHVNLGWLLLSAKAVAPPKPPDHIADDSEFRKSLWPVMQHRLALVTERIFTQVVNANLEVRTSVSIDPYTGAASDGALFSYEAIPRATVLVGDIVDDDYRGAFNPKAINGKTLDTPFDVAKWGLELAEWLGVGGMGTRGFGRLRLVADWEAAR